MSGAELSLRELHRSTVGVVWEAKRGVFHGFFLLFTLVYYRFVKLRGASHSPVPWIYQLRVYLYFDFLFCNVYVVLLFVPMLNFVFHNFTCMIYVVVIAKFYVYLSAVVVIGIV